MTRSLNYFQNNYPKYEDYRFCDLVVTVPYRFFTVPVTISKLFQNIKQKKLRLFEESYGNGALMTKDTKSRKLLYKIIIFTLAKCA